MNYRILHCKFNCFDPAIDVALISDPDPRLQLGPVRQHEPGAVLQQRSHNDRPARTGTNRPGHTDVVERRRVAGDARRVASSSTKTSAVIHDLLWFRPFEACFDQKGMRRVFINTSARRGTARRDWSQETGPDRWSHRPVEMHGSYVLFCYIASNRAVKLSRWACLERFKNVIHNNNWHRMHLLSLPANISSQLL